MTRHLYPHWRDENATLFFPFEREQPRTARGRELERGAILDARLHAPNSPGGYFLGSLRVSVDSVQFSFFDDTGVVVASGVWSPGGRDPSVVELSDGEGHCAGVIVVTPEVIQQIPHSWPLGDHTFLRESAQLVLTTWEFMRPDHFEEVTAGVPIESGGELYLVAEDGLRFECTDDPAVVKLHAIGDPLSRRKNCDRSFETPRLIREVVFQKGLSTVIATPDNHGQVWLHTAASEGHPALSVVTRERSLGIGYSS